MQIVGCGGKDRSSATTHCINETRSHDSGVGSESSTVQRCSRSGVLERENGLHAAERVGALDTIMVVCRAIFCVFVH